MLNRGSPADKLSQRCKGHLHSEAKQQLEDMRAVGCSPMLQVAGEQLRHSACLQQSRYAALWCSLA